MMHSSPSLLQEFAGQLKELCDAASAAVLVHLEPLERDNLLLAAAGEISIPELANEQAAWNFLSSRSQRDNTTGTSISQMVSQDGQSTLLCLPLAHILYRPPETDAPPDERRAYPVVHSAPELDGNLWVGIEDAKQIGRLTRLLQDIAPSGEQPQDDEVRLAKFVSLSARLAWQVYHLSRSVKDPVSQLAGRMEFEVFLKRALAAGLSNSQPLGLLLVNPDDFVMVNHRFGREQGDRAVREIAERLSGCIRQTDGVFRYGGAAFGLVLPATSQENTQLAADKFRQALTVEPYLDGVLTLEFTIGGAVADLNYLARPDPDPIDIVQRADNALNQAKLAGGGQILLSAMSDNTAEVNHFDPLNGIFTTDTEKDYRNMLLLWEAVSLVSSTRDPQLIASEFVGRLGIRFRPDRLALVSNDGASTPTVLAVSVRDDSAMDGRVMDRTVRFEDTQIELIRQALESRQMQRQRKGETDSPLGTTSYALPLVAGETTVGCLFLDGVNRRLQLDSTDLIFLHALANQLAVALERAELSANWIRDKDIQSRQLAEEVRELRQVLAPSKLVYESSQMDELMRTMRRVAPSEATVLIIGESGTGKEMLAHSVHEFSQRNQHPFVTVDCGAIAHTLLEAELFGHVKGAYTGAESASEGRIVQADGGTLFLDEIGELPLDLQTKLLRFVQEREITPVGGNKTRHVDVRIVAATNRELKDEVAAGRFRQDLYYRLTVVSVQAVPLRERPDDILPLARHFLEKFAAQNSSPCRDISGDAVDLLLHHPWPGNVRELQHTMLRAVLMCDTEIIHSTDIELHPETRTTTPALKTPANSGTSNTQQGQVATGAAQEVATPQDISANEPWERLRASLTDQVHQALAGNRGRPVPVGRWLQEDLVMAANVASGEVARRAARLSGVPESTFRRQLAHARAEAEAGLATRTEAWEVMSPVLEELVQHAASAEAGDLLDGARLILLDIVSGKVGDRNTAGAALMGVTPPTYKRWLLDRVA